MLNIFSVGERGAATPCRTVSGARSIKAVFSRPEKPIPRPRGREICLCSQAHHVRDASQLTPPVALFHLAVDQARCHLPPAHFLPSTTRLASHCPKWAVRAEKYKLRPSLVKSGR
jgi:hypothetical protein